jgi:hypothetical protein
MYQLYEPFSGGSGIFVNVGKSLVVTTKPELQRICQMRLQMKQFEAYPPELGPAPPMLVNGQKHGKDLLGLQIDNHLAACLQRLGYRR